jgi:hypothetical protein
MTFSLKLNLEWKTDDPGGTARLISGLVGVLPVLVTLIDLFK